MIIVDEPVADASPQALVAKIPLGRRVLDSQPVT
jgi:hypothetical protein